MKRGKIIVFDLGKVLLDFDYMKAAAQLLPKCGIFPLKVISVLTNSGLLEKLELGKITDDEFYKEISQLVKYKGTREDFMQIFGDIFTPIDEMIEFHSELKKCGFKTYIFSNTNDTAVKWISEHYPFFNEFDGYFLSYKMKLAKPNEAFYEALEKETGKSGEDIIYMDDKSENIEPALKRGWQGIVVNSPGKAISQVKQLLEIE